MNSISPSKSRKRYRAFLETSATKQPTCCKKSISELSESFLKIIKLKFITIDIDSSVVNVESHQEGAVKGYNPKNIGGNC